MDDFKEVQQCSNRLDKNLYFVANEIIATGTVSEVQSQIYF